MQPITAKDVVNACNGELVAGDMDTRITSVSTDTRTIAPGSLFVALTGENSDGHKFLADALGKGAVGVVVSHKVEAQCLAIRVADTLLALGDLAAFYRSKFSPTVVGVTGSVGKTTTKEMIAAVAAAGGPVLKNEGNFNNEIGLPLTLLNLAPRHKTAVVEMAMRGAGQIDYLARIAKPSIGVITNIHMSHIELLGSMDAIADAKGELLDHLPADGTAILNADDAYFDYLSRRANCRVVSFGESAHADVRAVSSGIDAKGCCHFEVVIRSSKAGLSGKSIAGLEAGLSGESIAGLEAGSSGKSIAGLEAGLSGESIAGLEAGSSGKSIAGRFDVHIPVPGEHNIKDALAAIAVGEELGIAHDDIKAALATFKAPEKRSNVIPSRRGFVVIDDTYNASPASVKSALKTLSMMEGDRKIVVLGDMLELGEHAVQVHLEIGRTVHECGIDALVAVGELAKLIARGAIDAGMPISAVSEFEDSAQAAKEVPSKVRERDVVLVKGSRAMKMERIVEGLNAA